MRVRDKTPKVNHTKAYQPFCQKGKEMHQTKQQTCEEDVVFTRREKDVLRLLADCQTNEEMCDNLSIGIETLMTHFKNIKRKTRIHTARKEVLIKYSIEHGHGSRATA